jgi:hypothetical protein
MYCQPTGVANLVGSPVPGRSGLEYRRITRGRGTLIVRYGGRENLMGSCLPHGCALYRIYERHSLLLEPFGNTEM